MSILQRQPLPQEDDLLTIVCNSIAMGTAVDPATVDEIEKRSDAVTESIRNRRGLVNVAVDLVRAVRDE